MDDRALARWRLHTLRLAGRTFPDPVAAVGAMLAVQGENVAQTAWALAARCPAGLAEPDVLGLLDDGAILRTHLLRPTWHLVLPDDIRWLVEVTAPGNQRLLVQQQRELGLDDATLAAAAGCIVEALEVHGALPREALAVRLGDAGFPAEGRRLGLMLWYAELTALMCSGPREAGVQTYALLDARAPQARRLDPEEARAELVLRYLAGHGPATERDLAYWATLTLGEVRAGLADVADRLERLEHDGRTYWYAEDPPPDGVLEPRGHLLLIFDEAYRGFQDSRGVIDADGLLGRGRESSAGMALVDGQMVGDMRRTVRARRVTFAVGLLRDLAAAERAALEEATTRYGDFLGREAELVTAPLARLA